MNKTYLVIFFISLLFSLNIHAQELCNPNSTIFVVTEIMPEPSPDLLTIEGLINNNFNAANCDLQEGDKIVVKFKINCEGEDFDYKVVKFNKEEVNCGLDNLLQSTLTWTKAKQGKIYVDFSGTIVFIIKNSKFVLFSKSVNNMKNEKKKRIRKK